MKHIYLQKLKVLNKIKTASVCINAVVNTWLRGKDLNQRPPGYGPDELPDCSTPRCEYNNIQIIATLQGRKLPIICDFFSKTH